MRGPGGGASGGWGVSGGFVGSRGAAAASLPAVVLDHVSQLDDELSLFVLLTALEGVFLQQTHNRHTTDTQQTHSSVNFNLQHHSRNVFTDQ